MEAYRLRMRIPFYDIKAQYTELAPQIDAAVHEVVSSGNYVLGPNHNAFEKEVAGLHGVKHALGLNSGTDALRIMLDASGIGPGDEVITTAFTFVASAETIVQAGASPVFVEIDPTTFLLDPARIEAAITPKTKAIMPIHLFGQLCDVDAIRQIAEAHRLVVLEDAAQAIGVHHNGVHAGKFGASAGLSFYVTKNLGAAGDAGMILTDDDEIADRCRSIRIHGMGRQRYYYDHLGYTSRLDELQAAILRVKLTKLQEWNNRRAALAAIYLERLGGEGVVLPQTLPGNNHTYHQFSIQTPRRDELKDHLAELGIDTMIYYPVPIHFHGPYERFGGGEGSLPITERVSREVLSLPLHPHLVPEQIEHIAKAVNQFLA